MSAVAVGNHVEKCGSELLLQKGLLAAESVDDGERVVSVHSLGVHCIGLEACAESGGEGVSHSLSLGLSAHCVLVVHHVEQHGKSALHIALPEGVELVHGCEGHTLEDRSAGHGSVAQVGNYDTLLAVDFLIECGSDCD